MDEPTTPAPIATPEQAAQYGYTVTEADLRRASARIRGYTGRPLTAVTADWLIELTSQVASRLSGTGEEVASGVVNESAGGESVGYGMDAYRGAQGLTSEEKAVLDRRFGRGPRPLIVMEA